MKRLKPLKPEPVRTPQCEAPFDTTNGWSKEYLARRAEKCEGLGWDINRCGRPSTYEIEGECLCTQHAGLKAIKILLERDES